MFSGRTPRLSVTVPVVLAFLVLFFVSSAAASAQDEDLKALFEQGKEAFYKAHYDEALKAFQAILAQNPSNELAFQFWEEAGDKIFLEMLIKEGEYEKVARRFIELARVGRKMKQEDPARIKELAGKIVSGDYRERREALLELEADHGEYAVEYLYNDLANEDVEARVNVIGALSHMGEDAALPLVQVLSSENEEIQRNAAVVLGRIKDLRSLPALKKLYSDAGTPDSVKTAAGEAIYKICGKEAGAIDGPSVLFCNMAESYLKGDERICKPFLASRVIWKWKDGGLTKIPAAPGFRNLELAEEACFDALDCDAGNVRAVSLLALAYASQMAEIEARGEPGDNEGEALSAARASAAKAPAFLALCGPDRLQEALSAALENHFDLAAYEIVKVMDATGNFSSFALKGAFAAKDKRLRYAAAFAAVRKGIIDRDVIITVTNALGETSLKKVLVIDDNPETRNSLLDGLNEKGFFAVGAATGVEGLARAKDFPPKDLVIARSSLKDLTVDSIVYEMGAGPSAGTPILLLAPESDMENLKSLWEGKVAGFLKDSEVKSGAYLAVVNAKAADLNDAQKKALEISTEAAKTLALLDGSVLADVVDDLVLALDKPDAVKIPVLKALAKTASRNALESVAKVFNDTSAASPVRVEAARALGSIFASGEASPGGELLDSLKEALGSDNAALRLAAAEAIGKAVNLESETVKEILSTNRI